MWNRPWYAWVVVGAIVLGIALFVVSRGNPSADEFVIVDRGVIFQKVTVTGKVKAIDHAVLGLEKSGRVSWIGVAVGDSVYAGELLLSIENGDLAADLDQAHANVKKEQAKLLALTRGTRPEEIAVEESKVESAAIALEDARRGLLDVVVEAYTKSDDAVRNKIDQFFSNPRFPNAELNFRVADGQLESDIEVNRVALESALVLWEKDVRLLSTQDDLSGALATAKKNLEAIRLFLEKTSLAVNGLTANAALTQATIDTYKSSVFTARTNINTAISGITAAEEKFRSAAAALATAEKELALKRAGSSAEDITVQEAALEYAEAEIKGISAQIAKTIIRAPFSGVVVKQDARVGEILSAGSGVITLISQGKFRVEANVPEADIAKIKIGDAASVTLDAYGSDVTFGAAVSLIEPGETIIDGVPTYKTVFEFVNQDERIKSGLTANLDIAVSSLTGVLRVPQRAISGKNGTRTVTVFRNGTRTEVQVAVGLRGANGFVEIINGVSEGESVLLPKSE